MSRPRTYTYAGHPQPTPAYYYDDLEGYIGDYSESDGVSDTTPHHVMSGLPPDVTELYRRKTVTAMANNHDHYTNGYLQGPPPPPSEYYYETMPPQPSQMMAPPPPPRTAIYRKRMPVIAERPSSAYYPTDRPDLYDFRSTHQLITSLPRTAVPASIPSATAVRSQSVRRHPITVRTPKYYRRSSGPTLVKRPSALCLPVSCQPDPAVYKRTKRLQPEPTFQPLHPLPPAYMYQTPLTSQPTSQFSGDNNGPLSAQQMQQQEYGTRQDNELSITKSKLDAALERYEQIFEKNVVEFTGSPPDVKLVRLLKPKIPSTIKEKEENNKRNMNKNDEWANNKSLDVEEITTDTLEEMLLADLQANGFANEECGDFKISCKEIDKKDHDKSPRSTEGTVGSDKVMKDLPKSFNYEEIQAIQNNVAKTALAQHNLSQISTPRPRSDELFQTPEHDIPKKEKTLETATSIKDESRSNFTTETGKSEYSSRPTSSPSNQRIPQRNVTDISNQKSSDSVKSMRTATVPRVLVDDALELHRTKSYVVNLIDHALSNHFGTNLCEKYSTKENPIDHRVAVEILKKHSAGKMDKELCVEIAQALADTFNSSTSCASAPCRESETKRHHHHETGTCSCSKIPEEPLYVKQLKQLRWGHLKHIQREVRRLEDLERFLDSCSSNSFV